MYDRDNEISLNKQVKFKDLNASSNNEICSNIFHDLYQSE